VKACQSARRLAAQGRASTNLQLKRSAERLELGNGQSSRGNFASLDFKEQARQRLPPRQRASRHRSQEQTGHLEAVVVSGQDRLSRMSAKGTHQRDRAHTQQRCVDFRSSGLQRPLVPLEIAIIEPFPVSQASTV
jgi:hypothetical protein